ncbi:MAG: hypothetical protein H0W61_16870 [Bacteroidetes bacterium]|nr:hypothetical protein [Bacteroidota bacterium]
MTSLKKGIVSVFACLLSVTSFAQTADEIVAKHVEAIGGKENWLKVKSIKMECSMKAQGAEIKMNIAQVNKKAMRYDINVMGMSGWSILTNTEGWSFMPFQGQTKPEPMTADDVKSGQDGLEITDDFLTYKASGKKLEYLGKDDVDGTECHKLKMIDKDKKETTYYMDVDNFYVIKKSQKIQANGKEMEETTMYSNYKKLPEGIVFAMSFVSGFGQTEIVKLEINPKIDESIFKPTK